MIENWKESKIGTLLKICYGKDKKNIEEKSGKYDIWGTGGVIGKTNTCLYSKPSVLIGRKGTIDKPIYLDVPFWTVDTLFYSEIFDVISPKLLYYYFNTINWRKYNEATGVPSLSAAAIESIKIIYPINPKEQKKIADILESVDNSIDSTKKAIEKYKLVKQGMMQDLLTRGLDKNGKLRPTYEEAPELYKESKLGFIPKEWECEPAIKNICILNGGTPSTTNTDYWNGNIGWLSVDDFNTGNRYVYCSKKTITTLGLKNSSTTLLKKGMIIISARGTVGVIAQLGAELTFNQSCYGIDGAENLKNDFLYYCLKHNVWQTKKYSYGNVFDTITKDTFKDMNLSFPKNLKEQQQIADRLTAIDNKIETEQTYLLKLQKIKQGLMQDLLTGKVRCKF